MTDFVVLTGVEVLARAWIDGAAIRRVGAYFPLTYMGSGWQLSSDQGAVIRDWEAYEVLTDRSLSESPTALKAGDVLTRPEELADLSDLSAVETGGRVYQIVPDRCAIMRRVPARKLDPSPTSPVTVIWVPGDTL